jgi:PKD repeat protein
VWIILYLRRSKTFFPMRLTALLLFLLLYTVSCFGQVIHDIRQSVMIEAVIQTDPAQITLQWMEDPEATAYTIFRRPVQVFSWGTAITTLGADVHTWTDTNVATGEDYEYRVQKTFSGGFSNGYLYAGIEAPPTHYHGICVLVIDSTHKEDLSLEIDRLVVDLEDDGWQALMLYVDPADEVTDVRAALAQLYLQNPAPLHTAFLLGAVPTPYSGNIAPDGHIPDHQGAWPCDGYYGDINGIWTDNTVNFTQANDPRNRNIPGDGKFDQNTFPSLMEYGVGRVDFSRMPAITTSEVELLRQYLDKDHGWRRGHIKSIERGIVQNNFGGQPEGFGQNGWKNFTPMFGIGQVHNLPYRTTLQNESYLWSYGAGPGSSTSAGGITNTGNYNTDSLQTIFTVLFGSYFGDWGYTNNLLRAALASGTTLTNAWAGRPNWMFHHMALGMPIGFSTKLSMDNVTLYQAGFSARGVHMGLMGDPTLRMHVLSPPQMLTADQIGFDVFLTWDEVDNAAGYHIYKREGGASEFVRLTDEAVTTTEFYDVCAGEGTLTYQVRAMELRQSASGSYYNLSSAGRIAIDVDLTGLKAVSDFTANVYFDLLMLTNASANALSSEWTFGNGASSDQFQPDDFLYADPGEYTVCLTSFDACYSDTWCQEITITNSLPEVEADILPVRCHGETNGRISLTFIGGTFDLDWDWFGPYEGNPLTDIGPGGYFINVFSATGKQGTFGPFLVQEPEPIALEGVVTHPSAAGADDGRIALSVTGGWAPYTVRWCDESTDVAGVENLGQGLCCVELTDELGCEADTCFLLEATSSLTQISGVALFHLFPNPTSGSVYLQLRFEGEQRGELQLLNTAGMAVSRWDMQGDDWSREISLDHVPAGRYWLLIHTRAGRQALPIEKME